jgi:hypothetical protein
MATAEYEVINEETGEVQTPRALVRQGSQLAPREMVAGLLRPVARPQEILQAQNDTRDLIAQALQKGRDYDTIPGTNKPTMLQPGAERACAAFGLTPSFELIGQEVDHDRPISYVKRTWEWHPTTRGKKIWTEEPGKSEGLYRYVLRCRLIHRESGIVVGEGIGSCSTMEAKYVERPRDLENTVLKIAKKRAFVDATLTTLGLHDQFTQDIEDNPAAFGLSRAPAPEINGRSAPPKGSAPTKDEPEAECPKCGGRMWDNRVGKKNPRSPDYKCRDKACDGVFWPGEFPPQEASADDAAELDRLADGIQQIVREIRQYDETQGADAERVANAAITAEAADAKSLRKTGAVLLQRLNTLKEEAAVLDEELPF